MQHNGSYTLNTLWDGVPFDKYRNLKAINASGLKHILRSPAHYLHELTAPRKDTPALKMGRLVHQAVLEPELLNRVFIAPDHNLRTKQGKQDRQDWLALRGAGAEVVTRDERDQLTAIVEAARSHTLLTRLLAKGRAETTLLWQDPAHKNTLCKARFDWVADDTLFICDLKTCQDARHHAFSRDAWTYGYLLQAAHYLEGARMTGVANPDKFIIIAIEKTPPYALQLYDLAQEALDLGHQQRHAAMEQYVKCTETGVWPSYPHHFAALSAPAWAQPL